MGRQKAVIKARREAKRVIRRDARSHRQLEEESVTSLVQMGGVESIGMARDNAMIGTVHGTETPVGAGTSPAAITK